MKFKATVYRLAFSAARAAVIGNEREYQMHRDPQGRQPLPGLGGGGVDPTLLRCSRRGIPGGRQIPPAHHAARVRRRRGS